MLRSLGSIADGACFIAFVLVLIAANGHLMSLACIALSLPYAREISQAALDFNVAALGAAFVMQAIDIYAYFARR